MVMTRDRCAGEAAHVSFSYAPGYSNSPSTRSRYPSPLRVNGLDSQSCFDCHNSIGSAHLPGEGPLSLLERKAGTTSGSAGFASNAFIGGSLPGDPNEPVPFTEFVRNPPHVFGTGYVQKLAEEMSYDLLLLKEYAVGRAILNPGKRIVQPLKTAVGPTDFGVYSVIYTGPRLRAYTQVRSRVLRTVQGQGAAGIVEDYSGVHGVSRDLVVRPLQWKGIASNERNFVRSALAFHFGTAPKELNPGYMTQNEDHDPDHDGKPDEVLEGEVTELTVFTMLARPPTVQPLPAGLEASAERGKKLFMGMDSAMPPATSCASCHTPSLRISNSMVCVRDPRGDPSNQVFTNITGLVASQKNVGNLPTIRKFIHLESRMSHLAGQQKFFDRSPEQILRSFRAAVQTMVGSHESVCAGPGYQFDLSLKSGDTDLSERSLSLSYPRLPENVDGSVDVPLFSDLKRHDMGDALADSYDQGTDVQTIAVNRREFLTRPLWGVADTGPWLHDGRARTLREAILLHKSNGSEANPVIDSFLQLSATDQSAIVNFLLTLRLPVNERYSADNDAPLGQ